MLLKIRTALSPSRITLNGTLTALLVVMGVGLVVVNAILLRDNRAIRTGLDTGSNIEAGKHISRRLAAATLDGGFSKIPVPALEGKRTLLITFSPGCPYCKVNQKYWSLITSELRRIGTWNIVWVSRDPVDVTTDYCADSGIPLTETFADPTYLTYTMLDLKVVPSTVVIDDRGVVQRIWRGQLNAVKWKELSHELGLSAQLIPFL